MVIPEVKTPVLLHFAEMFAGTPLPTTKLPVLLAAAKRPLTPVPTN